MKKIKKTTAVILSVVMLFMYVTFVNAQNRPIGVYLDGRLVNFGITNGKQVEALTIYDYAYVPVARIVEILTGAPPNWNDATKTASYVYNGKSISIDTRKSGIYINNVFVESVTGTPPVIVNDRTLIPLKMLTGAMGFGQSYDASTHTVWLTTPVAITPSPNPTPTPQPTPAAVSIIGVSADKDTIIPGESTILTMKTNSSANYVWVNYDGVNNAATYQMTDSSGAKLWSIKCYPSKSQNITVNASTSQTVNAAASKSIYVSVNAAAFAISSVSADKNTISAGDTIILTIKTNSTVEYVWVNFDNTTANAVYQSKDSAGVKTWTLALKPAKTQELIVYANKQNVSSGAVTKKFNVTVNAAAVVINSVSVDKNAINAGDAVILTVKTNSAVNYVWVDCDNTYVNASYKSTDAAGVKTWTVTLKPSKTQTLTIYANIGNNASGAAVKNQSITVDSKVKLVSVSTDKTTILTGDSITMSIKTNSAANYVWAETDSGNMEMDYRGTDSSGNKNWSLTYYPKKSHTAVVYAGTARWGRDASDTTVITMSGENPKIINASAYPGRTWVTGGGYETNVFSITTNSAVDYVSVLVNEQEYNVYYPVTVSGDNYMWEVTAEVWHDGRSTGTMYVTIIAYGRDGKTEQITVPIIIIS